jgi:hypothetical protein
LDAAHEIFQKPFKVDLELDEIDTPANYRRYPEGVGLPPKMQVWRVHPDKLKDKNVGLVSDGYGFTDSPDCEYVSSGLNSKGPGSVALGRQGNWFLWGFCAAPSDMTEPAKRAFLNTVVYMKRFDGQRALVTNPTRSRQWAYAFLRLEGTADKDLGPNYEIIYSPALLELAGNKGRKLAELLKADEGWIYWEEYDAPQSRPDESRPAKRPTRIAIDQDAKALGIANNDPKILDRAVEMLAKGDRKDVALRILERYTDQKHGTDAAAWRAWLDGSKGRLYFTDTGGYRFRVKDAR